MMAFFSVLVWIGEKVNRVICILSRSHFPPPDRIEHLRRVGILDEGEMITCIHCGKELGGQNEDNT